MITSSSTTQYNRKIVNEASLTQMSNVISGALKRNLTDVELADFFGFVKSQAMINWNMHTDDQIRKILVRNYLQKKYTSRGQTEKKTQREIVDVHEILKYEIGATDSTSSDSVTTAGIPSSVAQSPSDPDLGLTLGSLDGIKTVAAVNAVGNIQSILGKSDSKSLQMMFNPSAAENVSHIILDTRWRLADPDGTRQFSWVVLNSTTQSGAGIVNCTLAPKNITKIRVYPTRMPYQDVVFTSAYKRVSMLINEFNNQSFIGQESQRFHFLFDAEADDNMIVLSPLPSGCNAGLFQFTTPITQIDTLTISFGNPLEQIFFDPDRLYTTVTYTNPGKFTTSTPHNLKTADQVYFSTFTSNDPVQDQVIINQVNAVNGYNIFVVDPYNFEIDGLDLTQVQQPIAGLQILCYFGSKRIFIPMDLIYSPGSVATGGAD